MIKIRNLILIGVIAASLVILSSSHFLSKGQPLLEIFRINKAVTNEYRTNQLLKNIEYGKKKYGYCRNLMILTNDDANIFLGEDEFTPGFYYLSNSDFSISGANNYPVCEEYMGHVSLRGNKSQAILNIHYINSFIYLWMESEPFEDKYLEKDSIEEVSVIPGTATYKKIFLDKKEYAFVGGIKAGATIFFRSSVAFKMKLANCPEHYFLIEPKNNKMVYKYYFNPYINEEKDCFFQNYYVKGRGRPQENLYIYDPEVPSYIEVWIK